MSYWLREIAGWALVALGLFGMYLCWLYLREGMPIQAGPLTIIAIILFRGGIHLLKVFSPRRSIPKRAMRWEIFRKHSRTWA